MGEMSIVLKPTRRKERLGAIEYRIYQGVVPGLDLRIEMLGLFRVFGSLADKERFERAVAAVSAGDPPVISLLTETGLSKP